MANIGATTAFYKVETALTKANLEVSKSMERLATGKANANAGDRSSYVAMADTFRLDFVSTKAAIKGAAVVQGYLETGMRVLDAASGLLARLQELAVLGANNTNTTADHEAINSEAEALGDEFNRLMTKSTYKGKNVFVAAAGGEYLALGGRSAEMSFGIKTIDYSALYTATATSIAAGPTSGIKTINLRVLPSEAVIARADASDANSNTEVLTSKVEAVQKLINAARVQAGSQYAAIESAVSYATDLTAQYELGYNAVSDVNFSMETAHLAKNQILQQAATAMLAQANSGQQGLLQLIQG
jgi:flagellin